MLRYLKGVQMIKKIIEDNNLQVMATVARYACAYEAIAKQDWWDKSKRYYLCPPRDPDAFPAKPDFHSCGPVVEQGTHFCDLSRYFGGDVDISTVTAHSLEWHENPGHLSKQTIDESRISPENRVPRVTSATWKYESGAVGSFIHVVALQGHDYSCELEVYADGYQFKYALFLLSALSLVLTFFSPRGRLVNPYVQPVLYIRRPSSDLEETHRFPDDDPFFSEISNLIDVVEDIEEDPENAIILSSYEGAWTCSPNLLMVTQTHVVTLRRVQDV